MGTTISTSIRSLVLAVAIAAAAFAGAQPASAAPLGNVWVITPKWAGHCPGDRNFVTRIDYTVWSGSWSSTGGDGGDDIVYPRVQLNQNNQIQLAVQCARTLPASVVFNVWPTRTGINYFVDRTGRLVLVR